MTLDNAAAAALTGNALVNVSDLNGANNVTITNNTVGHTENLTLSNVSAGTIADAAATTVNVVSNGTANAITLTAGAATALNITGSGNFTDATALGQAAAVITATGETGNVTMTLTAGQAFTGGTGVSTITTDTALQTAAVTAGAGVADKLIVSDAANVATTGAALYTGFEVLQDNAPGAIDASKFTHSAFTSVVLNNATANVTGLNATQAANVSDKLGGSSTVTLGVTGATTVGQLDTVHITANATTAQTFTDLVAPGVETINLTTTKGLTVNTLLHTAALTAMNVDGAGAVSITTGALALNVNTVIDGHLNTGGLTVDASAATANGLKIVGSATAANTLTGNSLASVLIGGNGGDTITGRGAAGNTITAGNGNNTIVSGSGGDTITVGNGFNTIMGGAGADIIAVGTGGNVITGAGGLDAITLGTHTLGTVDTLKFGAAATAAGSANMETVTGFVSGTDQFQVSSSSLAGVAATSATTAATMLAVVTDATSVANTAAVYTELATVRGLDNTTNAFVASTAAAGGLVAREVTFTTGAAAGTYLVINDSAAGFQAANDIVVKLDGNTTVAAGDFAATSIFTLTTANDTFTGGAGADTFNGTWTDGSGLSTFNPGDILIGGGGVDTLNITSAAVGSMTLTDASWNAADRTITNFNVTNTGAGAISFTTGAVFNADFNAAPITLTTLEQAGGATTITMTGYTGAATINATTTDAVSTSTVTITTGSGVQNVTAHSNAGAITITGTAAATGADSFTAVATGAASTATVTVTGSAAQADTIVATANGGAVTVTGGTGIDSITANTTAAVTITSTSTAGDTLLSGTSTGSGHLAITASGAATTGTYNITANAATGTDAIVVTGGTAAGTEIYNIGLGAHTAIATISTSEIGATVGAANTLITGAATADVIHLINASGGAIVNINEGAQASVAAGLTLAFANTGGLGIATQYGTASFTYLGNTYLAQQVSVVGTAQAAGDTVIELVGTTVHTFGTVTAGVGSLS